MGCASIADGISTFNAQSAINHPRLCLVRRMLETPNTSGTPIMVRISTSSSLEIDKKGMSSLYNVHKLFLTMPTDIQKIIDSIYIKVRNRGKERIIIASWVNKGGHNLRK